MIAHRCLDGRRRYNAIDSKEKMNGNASKGKETEGNERKWKEIKGNGRKCKEMKGNEWK